MITGKVNAQFEIELRLPVRDAVGQEQEVEVMLDTGFSGFLTLPPAQVARMGLPWHSQDTAILANRSAVPVEIHTAVVIWDGMPCRIRVQAIDAPPILGTGLLAGYDLRVRWVIGGRVEIEAIP
jgi:clan AA aspartic protease